MVIYVVFIAIYAAVRMALYTYCAILRQLIKVLKLALRDGPGQTDTICDSLHVFSDRVIN